LAAAFFFACVFLFAALMVFFGAAFAVLRAVLAAAFFLVGVFFVALCLVLEPPERADVAFLAGLMGGGR
jgi:hypothetical protein